MQFSKNGQKPKERKEEIRNKNKKTKKAPNNVPPVK